MRVGSLFAGIGGFDLAAERAGMTVEWQSELDTHASRVLDHHWPAVKNYGDIHEITLAPQPGRDIPDAPGVRSRMAGTTQRRSSEDIRNGTAAAVDVLCGGFPCQDYSVAGKRGGLAGDRGALWWQFHRLIAEGLPTWIVGENVPGLLSSREGHDFATIISSLVGLGYGVVWRVFDAQWFGVAQRRRRVFIVGHSGGEPRPEVLALGQSVSGDSPPSRTPREDVAGTLAPGSQTGGHRSTDLDGHGTLIFSEGRDENYREVKVTDSITEGAGSRRLEQIVFAQNQRDELRDLGNLAGAVQAEPGMKQQTYVTAPSVRRLTPLECERLQGFPDGWTAIPGNSDTQRYRQLGNAVAVPVVEWILKRLVRVEA